MSEKNNKKEQPEVYALRQDGEGWQISRRDFLKTAGIGAAAISIGLNSRFVRPVSAADDMESLCKNSLAHDAEITHLLLSPDGRYLISRDSNSLMKCWDFQNYSLLGRQEEAFKKNAPKTIGWVGENQVVLSEKFEYYEVPLSASSSMKSPIVTGTDLSKWTIDGNGNIYSIRNGNTVYVNRSADKYQKDEKLCSLDGKALSLKYLDGSKKLFLQMEDGFGVFDPESNEIKTFDSSCPLYVILPGESRVLICDEFVYRVNSLIDGHLIWSQSYSRLNASPKITGAAVSPDGSIGIIGTSGHQLWLVSMADGSPLKDKSCGSSSSNPLQIAVANDGSKFAVAVGQSILFISLPDFEVIGCPVDLTQMKSDTKGIEIKGTDPVTGQTVTYTLPCGSPIPAGAVCVCNCVAGDVCPCVGNCSCVGYTCSCVGNTCSCQGNCSCNSVGYHYWHPN